MGRGVSSRPGQFVHNCPLLVGHVKVSVDDVVDEFRGFALPVPLMKILPSCTTRTAPTSNGQRTI